MIFSRIYRLPLMMAFVLSSWAHAQQGPEVPCVNCPEMDISIYPEMGIWRNPEQSGTGFMFEVQNGHLGGFYYLYDEDGNPIWYIVTGQLQVSEEAGVMWELETDLELHQGGACLNCDHRPPELGESPGRIRLEFTHRNLGRFSVDGAPTQNIVPLTHGISGGRPFAPETDYVFPDLQGWWVLVFDDPGPALPRARAATLQRLSLSESDPAIKVRYLIFVWEEIPDDVSPPPPSGRLECRIEADFGPACEIEIFGSLPGEGTYLSHLANVGHRRFAGLAEQGHTLEAHRLDFD